MTGSAWSHNHDQGLNIKLMARQLTGLIVLMPPKADTADEAPAY